MLPTRDSFQTQRNKLKVRGWKKIFHGNGNEKNGGVAMLISDKRDFKTKTVIRDKEHYLMIKGSIQEEEIMIVNIYAPKMGAPKYIKPNINKHKGRNRQ